MQGLTDRQQQVLHYIRQSINERGYPPTLREIGAHMGIRSTNGVNDHLRALERKGYLRREDMKSRALRPRDLDPSEEAAGNAPTGRPRSRAPPPRPTTRVPTSSTSRCWAASPPGSRSSPRSTSSTPCASSATWSAAAATCFGLRVTGDSMIEAGIFSGDYIFVRKQITAQRGDIVVALIGDEATVKYFFPEKDYIRFQPANAKMAPILVRATDFRPTMLLGVVVGVFRKL